MDRTAEQPEAPPVHAEAIGHRYGARTALADVSFSVPSGTTALVGVNGAGKSTLLRSLAGAQSPTTGRVRIFGANLYERGERQHGLRRVAYMPQAAEFPTGMTTTEVVALAGWLRGVQRHSLRERARSAIDAVGLTQRRDEKVSRLSGGMVRRLALAQALVSEPEVLLLDEPSTGLDPRQRRLMVDLIHDLKDADRTIILSSHVIEDVIETADRVLVLDEGSLLFDGPIRGFVPTWSPAGSEPLVRAFEREFLRRTSNHASIE